MSTYRHYPHSHCSWGYFLVEEEEYFGADKVRAILHMQSLMRFEVVRSMRFVVVEGKDGVGNMHFVVVVEGKEVVGVANLGDNWEY